MQGAIYHLQECCSVNPRLSSEWRSLNACASAVCVDGGIFSFKA